MRTILLKLFKVVLKHEIIKSYKKSFYEKLVGSVAEWSSVVIVITMVSVQNLLAPFSCVLGKDILVHFFLLGGFSKQF